MLNCLTTEMEDDTVERDASKTKLTALLVSNTILWTIAAVASTVQRSPLFPITIVGGGAGSTALLYWLGRLRQRPRERDI